MKREGTFGESGPCHPVGSGCSTIWSVVLVGGAYLFAGVSLLVWATFLSRGALGIVDVGLGQSGALLFDALLSLVFFAQHSVMVRTSFKGWLGRQVRHEYHGPVYAIASGVALLGVSVLWQGPVDKFAVLVGTPLAVVRAVSILAIVGFIWGARSLDSFDMLGKEPVIRSLRGIPEPPPTPLTIRGAYRWVRHPLYLCCLLAIWACPHITADRLLYDIMWTGWIVFATMLEERDLVAAFGAPYQAYRARVPMLIPWRGPARPTPSRGV